MEKKEFIKNVVEEAVEAIFSDPVFYDEIEYLVNGYAERDNNDGYEQNEDYEPIEFDEEETDEIVSAILTELTNYLSVDKIYHRLGL